MMECCVQRGGTAVLDVTVGISVGRSVVTRGRRRSSRAFTRGAFQGRTHVSIRCIAFLLGDGGLPLGVGSASGLGLVLAFLDIIVLLWDNKGIRLDA
jgi:hypothetical protein